MNIVIKDCRFIVVCCGLVFDDWFGFGYDVGYFLW